MKRTHQFLTFIVVICFIYALNLTLRTVEVAPTDQTAHSNFSTSFIQTTYNLNSKTRVSFRLHSPDIISEPSQFLSVPGYTCVTKISTLPPAVDQSSIFNFTTTITTDLKILFIGDSIMQQFTQSFYSSVLIHESNVTAKAKDYSWGGIDGRHVILRSFINGKDPRLSGLHVCSSISTPVHGGGVVAYYRLLDLPYRGGEKTYVYCKNEKGWSKSDVRELINYELKANDGQTRPLVLANSSHDNAQTTWYKSTDADQGFSNTSTERVGKFNAIVLRPPGPGWMELHEITRERIIESILLLHDLFGVETVILSTLMFNNNVLTFKDWEDMLKINEMITDVANTWNGDASGVKFVLVQDMAAFTNAILWMNANHLGYNVSFCITKQNSEQDVHDKWDLENSKFLLHRLHMKGNGWKFNPSISMVCNTAPICIPEIVTLPNGTSIDVGKLNDLCEMNVTADPSQCFFNRFSRDGMHWCVETIGPRYSASIACLLGCIYNGDMDKKYEKATNDKKDNIMSSIRYCENECNQRFMSLLPVEQYWLDSKVNVYSKSNM
eukprot:scaffold72399_cov49-Cyclotella_meneghiniana.AAC.8